MHYRDIDSVITSLRFEAGIHGIEGAGYDGLCVQCESDGMEWDGMERGTLKRYEMYAVGYIFLQAYHRVGVVCLISLLATRYSSMVLSSDFKATPKNHTFPF